MLRNISRFIRRVQIRQMSTNKDPEFLKQQFNKLREQTTTIHSEQETGAQENQKKASLDDLKSQFKGVSEDLSKRSGEAKTLSQRMQESYQNFKLSDIKQNLSEVIAERRKLAEQRQTDKDKQRVEEQSANSQSFTQEPLKQEEQKAEDFTQYTEETKETKQEIPEEPQPPKPSLSERYPSLAPLCNVSFSAYQYCRESLRETFMVETVKRERKIKRIEELRKIEEQTRLWEESGGDKANIPEWKLGALQVAQQKRSTWQKIRESVGESYIGQKFSSTKSEISRNPNLQSVSQGYSQVKEGVEELKESMRDRMDEIDNEYYHKVKDWVTEARLETEEARAVKFIRLYDPDFDIYDMEDELATILKKTYVDFLYGDFDEVSKVAGGQAIHYFKGKLQEHNLSPDTAIFISNMDKPVYLGVNTDEVTNPRFSYNVHLTYMRQDKGEAYAGDKVSRNYFVQIARHPEPDPEVGHIWQIVQFMPIHDVSKLD